MGVYAVCEHGFAVGTCQTCFMDEIARLRTEVERLTDVGCNMAREIERTAIIARDLRAELASAREAVAVLTRSAERLAKERDSGFRLACWFQQMIQDIRETIDVEYEPEKK